MTQFEVGQTATCSKTITESDVVTFAGLSGDFNPIHINKEYAQNTRFKERIAHGILTASLLSQLLGVHLPGEGSVYLEQSLKFKKPVFIGDTITAKGTVLEFDEEKSIIQIETECFNQDNETVLIGTAAMMVPKKDLR